jgi:hypothetical protein
VTNDNKYLFSWIFPEKLINFQKLGSPKFVQEMSHEVAFQGINRGGHQGGHQGVRVEAEEPFKWWDEPPILEEEETSIQKSSNIIPRKMVLLPYDLLQKIILEHKIPVYLIFNLMQCHKIYHGNLLASFWPRFFRRYLSALSDIPESSVIIKRVRIMMGSKFRYKIMMALRFGYEILLKILVSVAKDYSYKEVAFCFKEEDWYPDLSFISESLNSLLRILHPGDQNHLLLSLQKSNNPQIAQLGEDKNTEFIDLVHLSNEFYPRLIDQSYGRYRHSDYTRNFILREGITDINDILYPHVVRGLIIGSGLDVLRLLDEMKFNVNRKIYLEEAIRFDNIKILNYIFERYKIPDTHERHFLLACRHVSTDSLYVILENTINKNITSAQIIVNLLLNRRYKSKERMILIFSHAPYLVQFQETYVKLAQNFDAEFIYRTLPENKNKDKNYRAEVKKILEEPKEGLKNQKMLLSKIAEYFNDFSKRNFLTESS